MVRKALLSLTAEIRGMHQAAFLIGIFAFLSQALALLRDRAFTHTFGAGSELDLYFAAFRIPDFLFVIVASLVSAYVLIPFLSERLLVSQKKADQFLGEALTFFLLLITSVSAVAYVATPYILTHITPGLVEASRFDELVTLSRLLLLQPILLGLSGIFGAVTQLSHRFILYSLSPLFYNAGIMLGVLVLYPQFGMSGLGYGVVLGAFLHLLIQLPSLSAGGHSLKLSLPTGDMVRMVRLAIPRALALSSGQITLLALTSLASLFASGSIAIFSLAYNLQSVPLSIVAVSYSVAAFPTLAGFIARRENKEFLEHMSIAVRHILFWSIPATVLFIVLRAQIVRVILGSGEFTWQDTRLTAAALALFVLSVAAQGLNVLFIRAYYAAGKTMVPFLISFSSAALTILLAAWLTYVFKVSETFQQFFETILRVGNIEGTEVLMLALAYSCGVFFALLMFLIFFGRTFGYIDREVWRVLFQSFCASVVGGYAAYVILQLTAGLFDTDTFSGIFAQGLSGGLVGLVVIITLLSLLKSPELFDVIDSLSKRLIPRNVPPGQEL